MKAAAALCDRKVANTALAILTVYYTDGHDHAWMVNQH